MRRATRWFVVRLDPMPLSPMSPVAPLTHATPLALSLAPPPQLPCVTLDLGVGTVETANPGMWTCSGRKQKVKIVDWRCSRKADL